MLAVLELLLLILAGVSGLFVYRFLTRSKRFNNFVDDLTEPETDADDVRRIRFRAKSRVQQLKKDAKDKRIRTKDILKALHDDKEV